MSSDAKIQANRDNAKLSTGPKTPEGKTIASLNSRKHGLSSKSTFIPEGRGEEFLELYASLYEEVRPIGEIQLQYFEQMIHASWHTVIARELLTNAYHQMDEKKINNFTRLLGQHERAYARAHKTLIKLQTDLALRAIDENEPIADLPLTVSAKTVTNEANRLAAARPVADRRRERYLTLAQIGAAFRADPPASAPPTEPTVPNDTPIDTAA
jgi:hypothetical protein